MGITFGIKKKWLYKTGNLLKEVHREEKYFNTGNYMGRFDCTI
jgi:hypothetical protein